MEFVKFDNMKIYSADRRKEIWEITLRELKEIILSIEEKDMNMPLRVFYDGRYYGITDIHVTTGEDGIFTID
ncbi:MAG: hypothetical protein JU82_05170 [Sulfuricurvum sp. MLSB]|uniref:hypothetical protein n=1 Tax=Sulfuricurvum sp. MLSB TaxID=1537917 RepID=UPI0005023E1F|nr:hypothetical protein [Sulfuricurvum sp. MLSB]KFN40006.1 MAG: hypothetical protein JU82_05170 [Sulfuricurvum sp. MLSB]